MERIQENEDFLRSLIRSNPSQRKRLLLECTEDQFKSIVECLVNIPNIDFNAKEKKCAKNNFNVVKYFKGKQSLNLKKGKAFLSKHHSALVPLLSCILVRIFEEALVCVLN